jgi:hypothetical protein
MTRSRNTQNESKCWLFWIQERRIHVGLLKYHFFRDRKPKKERNTGELRVVHSYEAMFRRGSIGRLVSTSHGEQIHGRIPPIGYSTCNW